MIKSKTGKAKSVLLNAVLGMGITSLVVALASFAYLGTFTRYLADDYCEAVLVTVNPALIAVINRYTTGLYRSADRYSNLLFVGLSEFISPHNLQLVPVIMILLWTLVLIWLVREIKLVAGLEWPFVADIFLGACLSFFSILEAPNRFQVIYWRSSMATHFAPLVYLAAFSALLLLQIRKTEGQRFAAWVGPLFMALAFVGGGFSEPPDAVLIVASALSLITILIFEKGSRRNVAISITAWTLAGGVLALLVMWLAPGVSSQLGGATPRLVDLVSRTLLYAIQFIWDSIITLPVPSLFSILMPFFLFYYLSQDGHLPASSGRRKLIIIILATPILMYFLIAASFAPSVYGQSFPEERARFAGRLTLIAALMVEGACLGVALSQIKIRLRSMMAYLALGLLALSVFYPLRAVGNVLNESLSSYKQWASNWDTRQSQILADKAQGMQNLVIPQLPGIEHVKELDPLPTYWVNRCAAQFYGVNSISAPQMGNP